MSFYSFQGKGNNRRATLRLALKGLVHKITRESGEHYSIDQSVQKAKMMKCMVLWNNSANWGIVEQHRQDIIMPNLLALLHVCLLVGKGPLLVFVWRLVSLSLWQHLGSIAIAPCLWLLFLSGCTGQGERRDGGSLCVRSLFTKSSLYAGSNTITAASWRSRSAAGRVRVSCSPCSKSGGPGIPLLRRSKSLHEGGHSNSFLWVIRKYGEFQWSDSMQQTLLIHGLRKASDWNVSTKIF